MEALGPNDPADWVDTYGDYLFSFAIARLRDRTLAEDLVQETFLGAIRGAKTFEGRSKVRTWLTSILKNKIADHYRKAGRLVLETDMRQADSDDSGDYDDIGHIRDERRAAVWQTNDDNTVLRGEFWQVMQICIGKLPDRLAKVYIAREIDEGSTADICRMFGISENNLWVLLHRARKGLRGCLESNWFGRQ